MQANFPCTLLLYVRNYNSSKHEERKTKTKESNNENQMNKFIQKNNDDAKKEFTHENQEKRLILQVVRQIRVFKLIVVDK